MTQYDYTRRDLLEVREDYFYSALQGPGFIVAYRADRRRVLDTLPESPVLEPGSGPAQTAADYPADTDARVQTDALLDALVADPDPVWRDRLVQRFEVTKRLYDSYDMRMRAPAGSHTRLDRYAKLARILARDLARDVVRDLAQTPDLRLLNTLLKLNDLVCSQPPALYATVADDLRYALGVELRAVAQLQNGGDDE